MNTQRIQATAAAPKATLLAVSALTVLSSMAHYND